MTELTALAYEHDGTRLEGQLALPAGPGPHPAVLVMHNAHGLGPHTRERTLLMAKAGYAALATDMYGDGRYLTEPADIQPNFEGIQRDPQRLRERVVAGFEALRAHPQVDPGRIGAIGYCFGGQCVLELARSGVDAKAVVSFHGLLTTALPAKAGAVKAKVLVLTGAKDPWAPPQHVDALKAELAQAGADWQLTVYGEGYHAFTDPHGAEIMDRPGIRYDPLLEKLSWAQMMAFLDATVR